MQRTFTEAHSILGTAWLYGRVRAVTSEQFIRPAPLPAYSVLGHERWADIGLSPMGNWRGAVSQAMSHLATSD